MFQGVFTNISSITQSVPQKQKKKEYTVVTDKMFRANLKTNLKASTYDKEKNGHKKVSCIANLSLQFRHQTGILSQFILLNTVF